MNNAGGVRVTTVFYYLANGYFSINENPSSLILPITAKAEEPSAARSYALIETTIQLEILSWFIPISRKMERCVSMRCSAMWYGEMR